MKTSRIFVAGHRGMVGSAIVRKLLLDGYSTDDLLMRDRTELDLCDQGAVRKFFDTQKPDEVILAAARVGGIYANNAYPADFIYQNLMLQSNVIHQSFLSGVRKLLFLGSSCIYPRLAEQPMAETALMTGGLEPTNEPYAIAKIAGIKLCESYNRQHGTDYRSVMPTNLYGPNDNFHRQNSHVVPAMIRRFHEAVEQGAHRVTVWGTGTPMRELLHVDDMAAASLFVHRLDVQAYQAETEPMLSHINVGTGVDVTIRELAEIIADVIGFRGELVFDTSKPDGAPRKLMNVDRLARLGWRATIRLQDGLASAYDWFLENVANRRD